jgi:hypothetical protein
VSVRTADPELPVELPVLHVRELDVGLRQFQQTALHRQTLMERGEEFLRGPAAGPDRVQARDPALAFRDAALGCFDGFRHP